MLHLFYLGIMKNMLHALFNYCAIPKPVHKWYRKRCRNDVSNAALDNEPDSSLDNDENADDHTSNVTFGSTSSDNDGAFSSTVGNKNHDCTTNKSRSGTNNKPEQPPCMTHCWERSPPFPSRT
jgi:hypothetical protein